MGCSISSGLVELSKSIGFSILHTARKYFCNKDGRITVSDVAWFETDTPDKLIKFSERDGCMALTNDEKWNRCSRQGPTIHQFKLVLNPSGVVDLTRFGLLHLF